MRRSTPWLLALNLGGLLSLNSCQHPVTEEAADQPLFAGRQRTTFVVTSDRPVTVQQLGRMAKIIGPYRQLGPVELATIKLKLEDEIADLVEVEFSALEKAEQAKPKAQRRSTRDLRSLARERVLARLGRDLVMPLLTSDNRSAVVFGRLKDSQFEIVDTAYELDRPLATIPTGSALPKPDGGSAILIKTD
jgi:hypothetical protein